MYQNSQAFVWSCVVSVCTLLSCGQGSGPSTQGNTTTSTSSTSQVFYVSPNGSDSDPGTLSKPWRTISKSASTLVAGDTAIIMDGTYEEPEINVSHSGTQTRPITIRAQHKHQAILSSTSCNMGISVNGSYVTIEDIRVGAPPNGLLCPNTPSRATIRCWQLDDLLLPSELHPSTGNVGCTIRGVRIDYGTTLNLGIKTNQDFTLVENSEIHLGLEAFNNFGTVFRNNVVYSQINGLQGTGIFGKGGVRNLEIYNNIVYVSPGDYGLVAGGASSCCWWDSLTHFEMYNSVVYNNVVVALGGGPEPQAMGLLGAKDSALYNNIVIGGQIFLAQGSQAGFAPQPWPENPIIKNNIITCGGGAATSAFSGWTSTGLDLDYNNFFDCSSDVPPQTHPILAILGDPLFVDPLSNWHLLSGSPSLASGVVLAPFPGFLMPGFVVAELIDVSKNKDGITRPLPWNLGIY